jgi:hypothetical protein
MRADLRRFRPNCSGRSGSDHIHADRIAVLLALTAHPAVSQLSSLRSPASPGIPLRRASPAGQTCVTPTYISSTTEQAEPVKRVLRSCSQKRKKIQQLHAIDEIRGGRVRDPLTPIMVNQMRFLANKVIRPGNAAQASAWAIHANVDDGYHVRACSAGHSGIHHPGWRSGFQRDHILQISSLFHIVVSLLPSKKFPVIHTGNLTASL